MAEIEPYSFEPTVNLCETVRSQRKTMFTRVKMSAVEEIHRGVIVCHRESTAKSMENCPWPKNRINNLPAEIYFERFVELG